MKFAVFVLLASSASALTCRNDQQCKSNMVKTKCCSHFVCNAYCNTTRCRVDTCGQQICAKTAVEFVTRQIAARPAIPGVLGRVAIPAMPAIPPLIDVNGNVVPGSARPALPGVPARLGRPAIAATPMMLCEFKTDGIATKPAENELEHFLALMQEDDDQMRSTLGKVKDMVEDVVEEVEDAVKDVDFGKLEHEAEDAMKDIYENYVDTDDLIMMQDDEMRSTLGKVRDMVEDVVEEVEDAVKDVDFEKLGHDAEDALEDIYENYVDTDDLIMMQDDEMRSTLGKVRDMVEEVVEEVEDAVKDVDFEKLEHDAEDAMEDIYENYVEDDDDEEDDGEMQVII